LAITMSEKKRYSLFAEPLVVKKMFRRGTKDELSEA
jgi:hypothetical protein